MHVIADVGVVLYRTAVPHFILGTTSLADVAQPSMFSFIWAWAVVINGSLSVSLCDTAAVPSALSSFVHFHLFGVCKLVALNRVG